MNQKQRDEILVGLSEQGKKRDKAIEELSKQGKKTDKILQKLIERENTRDKMLLKIYEEQQKIKEEQLRQGNTLTRIEVEHGNKIALILDAIKGHEEKLEKHEERFARNEKMISKNSDEIFCLKLKTQ